MNTLYIGELPHYFYFPLCLSVHGSTLQRPLCSEGIEKGQGDVKFHNNEQNDDSSSLDINISYNLLAAVSWTILQLNPKLYVTCLSQLYTKCVYTLDPALFSQNSKPCSAPLESITSKKVVICHNTFSVRRNTTFLQFF